MPDELEKTDEIFVTGTAAEVTPVGEIDGRKFTVGTICQTLMEDYDNLVRVRSEAAA
jgi:branched-chain amino acid aminotransferase